MEYGLIGEHLGHSFSKEIHERIADYDYLICEIAKDKLDEFMVNRDFKAINVTIPYKERVMPHLFYIDNAAKKMGAVNTIVNRNGNLYGYNTDFFGLKALADKIGISFKNKKVLILGTGGTSKTAVAVAKSEGASAVIKVSRRIGEDCITYDEAKNNHADCDIIINTTPCGMYPDNLGMPIDLEYFTKLEGVIDVIYNPLTTRLVQEAEARGIKAGNGLYMLAAQAVFASELFLGVKYPEGLTDQIYKDIILSKQNVVLTGMPCSGKSTVGRMLADALKREFIDTDAVIEEKYGDITQIFEKQGEEDFRQMESEVIAEVSARNSIVIATGGGAVLKGQNIDRLKSNGKIFFIDRPLEDLIPTADRPLARNADAIKKRYSERFGIYQATADVIINADCGKDCVMQKILEYLR